MIFLFFAIVVFIFWISIFIITILLKHSVQRFNNTKKNGTAEVVGYDTSEGARWRSLIVKLNDIDDDKRYICNSGKIDIRDYPNGTTVDVIYASSMLGRQVYLAESMPVSNASMLKVFNKIACLLFVLMLALTGIGLYQVF